MMNIYLKKKMMMMKLWKNKWIVYNKGNSFLLTHQISMLNYI